MHFKRQTITQDIINLTTLFKMKKLKKSTTYQPPKVTIVFFKVEEGFASILSDSPVNTSVFNFGGETNGLMNHSTGDHSGLGQYGEGGNIFGETVGD